MLLQAIRLVNAVTDQSKGIEIQGLELLFILSSMS
jgi:hypothetical protein